MTELADLVATKADSPQLGVRRARVTAVSGRSVTVDIGGGITIPCADSCNPVPDQVVFILVEGTAMTAIASMSGVYKQATMVTVTDNTTTVTGLVNGVSKNVTKLGTFTASAGNVLPLIWSADGYRVWVGGPEGVPTVAPPVVSVTPPAPPPPPAATVTTGTATYAATWAGTFVTSWVSGGLIGGRTSGFFYGAGRFKELQGRTITGFRANIRRTAGTGVPTVYGTAMSGPSGAPSLGSSYGAINPSGWVSLPISLANYLIGGSGTGGLLFTGTGYTLNGLPYGALQFDWRK